MNFKFWQWKALLCVDFLQLGFGGGSSSSANQTTSTTTFDNHITAATDSSNVSMANSTVNGNVTMTDNGAVSAAFAAIQNMSQQATTLESNALGAVNANSTASTAAVQTANANALAAVNTAYSTAKDGEQKVMVAVGMVIVGIVAMRALK